MTASETPSVSEAPNDERIETVGTLATKVAEHGYYTLLAASQDYRHPLYKN